MEKSDRKSNSDAKVPPGTGSDTWTLTHKENEKELARLHVELVRLQEWMHREKNKIRIVFEGRDGAGKGGVLKALTERVSPRAFRVVALPASTEREKSQMYLQSYVPHLPAASEVVIFDRSWYNRAGVERVVGFCTDKQVKAFFENVASVERAMVDSGIKLLKYWLEVSQEEQTRRLESRITDCRKLCKLSEMDLKSYPRWYDYSRARDEMFLKTATAWGPWHVARSDDKKRPRLNKISHILAQIPYEKTPPAKIELPKRDKAHGYVELDYASKLIPQVF
jgi:polyphosphate kinase 2